MSWNATNSSSLAMTSAGTAPAATWQKMQSVMRQGYRIEPSGNHIDAGEPHGEQRAIGRRARTRGVDRAAAGGVEQAHRVVIARVPTASRCLVEHLVQLPHARRSASER